MSDLVSLKKHSPLVHNITNFVVMNSTANALLAIGACPVMAHATEEVEDMVSISSSLVLNIGTLSKDWVEAMILAGRRASERGIPVVFDPVGAGATPYRNEVCRTILEQCRPTIIRGNGSEIMALAGVAITTKGVDSSANSDDAISSAVELANATGAVVVISGPTDYITDGQSVIEVPFGSTAMTQVTGLGCTATAIIGAFAAVQSDRLKATSSAMTAMGIAGEIAAKRSKGNGSMQINFLDELCNLSEDSLDNVEWNEC